MHEQAPSPGEFETFLATVRVEWERLSTAVRGEGSELVRLVDDLGGHLLVTDEELRVQNEQLAQSTRRLDLLVAAHEELFANAPVAYLQTDYSGLIVQVNRAAHHLLHLPAGGAASRTLLNLVRTEDRPRLRGLITRLRAVEPLSASIAQRGQSEPIEVTLARPDGHAVPAVLTARRLSGDGATPLLHWELQERIPAGQPGEDPLEPAPTGQLGVLRALADAAAQLARQPTVEATMDEVARAGCELVQSCDAAGVMLIDAQGSVLTSAATGSLARACDHLQQLVGTGPGLTAIDTARPVRVVDLAIESRWPQFSAQAARLGAGSVLAVPLEAAGETAGALCMYARATCGFDEDAELVASAYATHAAVALANADQVAELRVGLVSRGEIGRAVGMIAERHGLREDEAFNRLQRASQRSHHKIRDVAAWVNQTRRDPEGWLRAH